MVFGSLKALFGASPAPGAPEAGPFGLTLGRAVALDTLRLRLEEGRLAMKAPPETLVITGHGVAELDAAGVVHRFYDDDGTMLQVLCSGGITEECVREITLYQVWDEVVPQTDREWTSWDGPGGRLGAAVFEADGFRFERVWGEPSTPYVEPAQFTESIKVDEGQGRTLLHRIVPYRREVGTVIETLLIAVERDLASSDRGSVTFMIGYGLASSDVNPV